MGRQQISRVLRRSGALAVAGTLALAACGNGGGGGGTGPSQDVGTISGTVMAGTQGVSGATVVITRSGAPSRTATSGTGGSFQFTQVTVGTWTVGVTPPAGYEAAGPTSATAQVLANQTATVGFQLQQVDQQPPTGVALITMSANSFFPNDTTIAVNTTVRWRNDDSVEHNTRSTGNWASPGLQPGQTFERQFVTAGIFEYECTLHLGMNGTIRVQ
jgi:plastocyanin